MPKNPRAKREDSITYKTYTLDSSKNLGLVLLSGLSSPVGGGLPIIVSPCLLPEEPRNRSDPQDETK